MKNNNKPTIGNWYKDIGCNEKIFEIVAIDPDEELIEIQYFDGEIGELELENWGKSLIIEVSAPEDWSGAYEMPTEDLYDYKHEVIHPIIRKNPIDGFELDRSS